MRASDSEYCLRLKEVKKKKEKQRQLLDSEDVLNDLEELQLSETVPEDGTNGLSFEAGLVSVSNSNEKRISNYSNTSEGNHVTDAGIAVFSQCLEMMQGPLICKFHRCNEPTRPRYLRK